MPVLRRLLVLLAVAGAGFAPAPATAAGYCSGSGVNVVVDFGSIGQGLEKGCGTGSTAAAVFKSAGVDLNRDAQYRGVVCQVEGLPTNANCTTMPASNAYWGLYWSDGTSGKWVYASTGVDGLKVPNGGFVAFAWQSSTSQRVPATAPSNPRPAPAPAPTKAPSTKATTSTTTKASTKPRVTATSAAASTTASPSASAAASASASAAASASASVAAPTAPATTTDPSPTDGPSAAAAGPVESRAVADRSGGGLPWVVPAGVLVLLAGGAGGVTWWRRRTTG
jgi:hypothetical protein